MSALEAAEKKLVECGERGARLLMEAYADLDAAQAEAARLRKALEDIGLIVHAPCGPNPRSCSGLEESWRIEVLHVLALAAAKKEKKS